MQGQAARSTVRDRQRGAVAILAALAIAVLLGMLGLAVDSGRLYINKAELQSAADACALAAAGELTCQVSAGACGTRYLEAAEAAGILAGARLSAKMQSAPVAIGAADVRFSTALGPNNAYLSRSAGANPASGFAMCIARAGGIRPWVMGLFGVAPASVEAMAVATRAPGASFCSNAPIGVCSRGAAPNFGYTVGDWIAGDFSSNGNSANSNADVTGGFRWVDFTPNAGGNSEIREQLAGGRQACGLRVGDNVNQPGTQQGAKLAYNTRFGIYANGSGHDTTSAPPDRTGYAWPNRNPGAPLIGVGTSAYANYLVRQAAYQPFVEAQYGGTGNVAVGQDIVATSAQLQASGGNRRLVAAPVIGCGNGQAPILGMACVLLLNPMSKGNNGTIYLEYRGNAAAAGSPCRASGAAGGPGGSGPLVPTLAQ